MSDEQNSTSKSQLINDLKSVTSKGNDVTFLNFETKKEKKKKKKGKKKESEISLLINGQYVDLSNQPMTDSDSTEENFENTIDTLNLIDSDSIFFGDDDDDEFEGIVKTQKGGYNKLKSDENIYKKEFSEELVLLYNLLDELNSFDKKLNRKVEGLDSTRARGMSKYTNDLIQSLLTCKTNKLQVLKEISNIKKTIVDLKMKDQKNGKNDSETSPEIVASSYLNQILGMGRNTFLKNLDNISMQSSMTNGLNYEEDDDEFAELLDKKLEGGTGRSDELEKYVKYESLEPKICVKKFIDTGDWEFIVIDKFNREIPDYPTPNPESVIPMKFGDDGVMATDKHGRSYKVIEVISGQDLDDDEFDE